MNKLIKFKELTRAIADEENSGFCIKCGNEQYECEPDARRYECESCGERSVYGAEEILLMGEYCLELEQYESIGEFKSDDIVVIANEMRQIVEDCGKTRKPRTWGVMFQLMETEPTGYRLVGTVISDKVYDTMNQFLSVLRKIGEDKDGSPKTV